MAHEVIQIIVERDVDYSQNGEFELDRGDVREPLAKLGLDVKQVNLLHRGALQADGKCHGDCDNCGYLACMYS